MKAIFKSYGSIPHVQGSKVGPADKHADPGHEKIATELLRDGKDTVYLQEKLDGANVSVHMIGGELHPVSRSGYPIDISSPYMAHKSFYFWFLDNKKYFRLMLNEGERAVGEWLRVAHGTKYNLNLSPFVLFDIFDECGKRSTQRIIKQRNQEMFEVPPLIHKGGPISKHNALVLLGKYGYYGATDPVEGCVWRVEREGRVDLLMKYVKPNSKTGQYLGQDIINIGLDV